MENENNEHQQLTTRERMVYFGLIPLVFTLALVSFGALLVKQGESKDFSTAAVGAVKSAGELIKSGYDWAVKKPDPPANTAGQPGEGAAGKAAAGTAAAGNGAAQPAATAAGTASSAPGGGGSAAPSVTASGATAAQGAGNAADGAAQFKQKTDEIAGEFSKMQPSQAAAIVAEMSTKDAVFTMIGMKTQQRSNILAKMDPKQAAALAQALKDFPPDSTASATDVQERLNKLPASQKSVDDLVKTYGQMPTHSAALLIMDLMNTNQSKAIGIMKALDSNARAQILSDMSNAKTNPDGLKYATTIASKLLNE
ncbi:magnesium transporter MgtE N-terminal domain-containing protein [Paenibacillus hamazuiensis]|uniref:magnesium transporter MgtE N-terminal domain-containing protein n=1 Tax=Paenibacillus hamazuiensis TaxID=2936508 RepID=UPI002010A322|nr:hypothetical protein [Paenibacillus hamazuiensis]